MSEEKFVPTQDETLVICNMTSTGTKLKDAVAKVKALRTGNAKGPVAPAKKEKVSPKDRKEALAKEIEALGGEAPAASASVAKFEEALTSARSAKVEGAEGEDLM